jgi:hypothetical protein
MNSKAYVSGLFWDWSVTLPERSPTKGGHAAGTPLSGLVGKAGERAGVGGLIGGAVGGIASAVAVIAAVLLVPSLSLTAAGPVVGTVAGVCAVGCGLLGALIGWGGPDARIEDNETEEATFRASSWKHHGAEHIYR